MSLIIIKSEGLKARIFYSSGNCPDVHRKDSGLRKQVQNKDKEITAETANLSDPGQSATAANNEEEGANAGPSLRKSFKEGFTGQF